MAIFLFLPLNLLNLNKKSIVKIFYNCKLLQLLFVFSEILLYNYIAIYISASVKS